MHASIESRRNEVAQLCQRHGVSRLEVFGSAARGDFDTERSDIDLLVQFGDSADADPLRSYFDLKGALEQLFGRSVDLVAAGAVRNPYVLASINRHRQVMYAA